jgi:hypothetical protein
MPSFPSLVRGLFTPRPARPVRPTLSVLVAVHERGGVAAACLEALRPIVDEIVVAFDSRTPADQVGPLQSVADILVGFEFPGPDQFRPWLREQAHGDWLLLLDGDEIPSAELLRQLPELITNRNVTGYQLPCWWIWPDPTRRLVSPPHDSIHVRLVKNDAHVWFPGLAHTGAICDPPARLVDAPFIHLDLLLNSEEVRAGKVRWYDDRRFPLFFLDGRLTNEALYLPERDVSVRTEAIPAADAEQVRRALDRRAERVPLTRPVAIAPIDDIERWWGGRSPETFGYRAGIAVLSGETRMIAGERARFRVEVANLGDTVWPPAGHALSGRSVALSYHWKLADGTLVTFGGIRTTFPARVAQQERVLMDMMVQAPDAPGRYRLVFDVVHEGVRWFGVDREIEVDVDPPVREQLAGRGTTGFVPIGEARSLRRRLTAPDALAAAMRRHQAGEDASPMDHVCLDYLLRWIDREGFTRVLEFGTGERTLAFARALAPRGGMMLSIDQDAAHAGKTTARIAESGLAGTAQVRAVGLAATTAGGVKTSCYDFTDLAHDIRSLRPQLVVIDGPPHSSGGSRLAIVPIVSGFIDQPAAFAMYDALRDAELEIGDRWQRYPGVQLEGIVAIGAGLLIGRVAGGLNIVKP